jgi:ADP-ribose pyrophosphatase YjhB (NUDIX family)
VAEYLLVEATNDPTQWVLPKGHVEETEHPRETAVREIHEETGIWAHIVRDMGDMSYTVSGARITVAMYLMQAIGRGLRKDVYRSHAWLPFQEAAARASHLETREILQAAEQRRSRMGGEHSAPSVRRTSSATSRAIEDKRIETGAGF